MPEPRVEDSVQRSIREFRETLRVTGISPIAEFARLAVLVRKHPTQARRILAELDSQT